MVLIKPRKQSLGSVRADPGCECARPAVTMQNDRAKARSREDFNFSRSDGQRQAPSPQPAVSQFKRQFERWFLGMNPGEHPPRQQRRGGDDQQHRRHHGGPSDAQFDRSARPQREQAAAEQQQADTRTKWAADDKRLSHQISRCLGGGQGLGVIRLISDLTHQFAMQHHAFGIKHHHCPREQAGERTVDNRQAEIFAKG